MVETSSILKSVQVTDSSIGGLGIFRVKNNLKPAAGEIIRLSRPKFSKTVIEDIEHVLKSGMLREGPITEQFEEYFRKRVNANYAYSVSSGTAALQLAVQSCVPAGSKVLVPAFTFIASASAVIHAGCRPVFVDIDPDSFLMDIEDAWKKVDEETRAVLPVHLFGNIADYEPLLELREEFDLCIVHDCAQALGSTYKEIELGEFDDLSCFSFYPTKIITTGEGGMVVTNNEEYAYWGRLMKNHGETEKYNHTILGFNHRSNEISAILGLDQLTRLEEALRRRGEIAKYYDLAIGNIDGIKSQRINPGTDSCYNYYTIQVDLEKGLSRDKIVEELRKMNIEAAIHYPCALTEQLALKEYITEPCPKAESLSKRVFSIPIHSHLSDSEMEYIVLTLRNIVKRYT